MQMPVQMNAEHNVTFMFLTHDKLVMDFSRPVDQAARRPGCGKCTEGVGCKRSDGWVSEDGSAWVLQDTICSTRVLRVLGTNPSNCSWA